MNWFASWRSTVSVFGGKRDPFVTKGSIRYYWKPGHDKFIRVDYHGSKEVPTGTCRSILKAANITKGR
ncbi:MAG TPA: type II toxin-antitoxin system HicA family toxin [Pyrinomonadaceae bacterium]|jgi:Predicted periplasmic or secreted lipoprotein|nr:type II toxin-antitoxin system HicA family toxin [Pyrinomonadaceae bacterium]